MSHLEDESVIEAEDQQTRDLIGTQRNGFLNMSSVSIVARITRRKKSIETQNCGFDHLIRKESKLYGSLVTEEKSNCSKALFRVKHNLGISWHMCLTMYIYTHT